MPKRKKGRCECRESIRKDLEKCLIPPLASMVLDYRFRGHSYGVIYKTTNHAGHWFSYPCAEDCKEVWAPRMHIEVRDSDDAIHLEFEDIRLGKTDNGQDIIPIAIRFSNQAQNWIEVVFEGGVARILTNLLPGTSCTGKGVDNLARVVFDETLKYYSKHIQIRSPF